MSRRRGRLALGAVLWLVMAGWIWTHVPADPESPTPLLPSATSAPPIEIVIEGERFSPGTVRIVAGATVAWRNLADVPHEVVGEGFASGPIAPGESYRHTFTRPGRYGYACEEHRGRGMVGAILVQR